MKKLLLLLTLTAPCISHGAWQGKLDLQPNVQPLLLREVADGQWLAGYTAPNIFHIDHNGNPIFHIGLFHAFNAEGGNSSFGPIAGLDLAGISRDIGFSVPSLISGLGTGLGLEKVFKPAALFAEALTLDAFIGYRPVHTADVYSEWVYGGGIALKIPFGTKNLEAGL